MQQFLICDDTPADAQALAEILHDVTDCRTDTVCSGAEAMQHAENVPYAALFLDIELAEDSSGICFARTFGRAYPQIPLIFYTGHIRYCEEIFTASPTALLLKPPTAERVRNVLEILRQKSGRQGSLMLPTGKNTIRTIAFEQISYIESIRRRLTVFDKDGQILAESYGRKLSEIAPQLEHAFVCCHQSIYVNLQQITSIRRYALILRSGRELPISQSRFQTVRKCWGDYLGGSL